MDTLHTRTKTHEKLLTALELLQGGSLSVNTFEQLRTLVKGVHPTIDKHLAICSEALSKLQKIQSGDIITLSAEGLPEDTDEKKKRKKLLLFFINALKNLQSEIKRVETEFAQAQKNGNNLQSEATAWRRILGFSKGPFGLITLLALVVVGILIWHQHKTSPVPVVLTTPSPTATSIPHASQTIPVIVFSGKQIPLTQLYVGHGSDCDSPHYHAITGSVTTLDGTVIRDPENCGYGRVKDVQVLQVPVTPSPTQ